MPPAGGEQALGGQRPSSQASGPGEHHRLVAPNGVDLAVVSEGSERLRSLPAGSRVGGKALVKEREPALEGGLCEVEVEAVQLVGRAEGFVDHGPERQRRDMEPESLEVRRLLEAAACSKRPTFSRVGAGLGAREQGLEDERRGRARVFTQRGFVHRHRPPGSQREAFGGERALHDGFARPGVCGIDEDHPHTAALRVPLGPQKLGGRRHQHAGPIAGPRVGRDRAAVAHAAKGL